MKVLIVNAGSSSLKYQLVNMDNEELIAKGGVERIGLAGANLKQKDSEGKVNAEYVQDIKDHVVACELMLKALQESGVIKSMDEIGAVGHRVLHGGEEFTASCIITEEVKAAIRKYIPLGPLHNPANLMGIEACEAVMPTTPQVAVFDTAFHQTMPPKAFMYGVPYEYYSEMGVRRYGFHGTSHRYVSKRVCEFLNIDPVGKKIIICHLGNGSSLSAVVDGKCVDTSMGLTPLEGLLMGTRCGSCDPAVVQFIANNKNMTPDEVLNMMNKQSGLLGKAPALAMAGGVSANRLLRRMMQEEADKAGIPLFMPKLNLCTDNAAMIASAAYFRLMKGETAPLTLNAMPALRLV